MKKIRFKIYYLLYLIPVFVLGFLFWQNTKPVLEVRCDFKKKTALCGELVPTARIVAGKDGAVIKEEPVYFDVKLPRKYDKAEVEIEYSNLKTDILEFGLARDEAKKSFDFSAVENKILDNLGWSKLEAGDLVLYQRPVRGTASNGAGRPAYKSITDFLRNPGNFKETFVYRANLTPKTGNLSANGKTVIDFPIKEKIKLMVYSKNAEPDIKVDAAGDYKISVTDVGGFERVEIVGGKDTVFNKISINSPYVAILDGIKIGGLKKELKIYFAGSRFLAIADTAGGLQKLDAAGRTVDVRGAYSQYIETFKDIKLREISVLKGNIELGGTLFFMKAAPVFYPKYEAFYAGADLSKINFILARYIPPQAQGEVKTASVIFDITDAPTPNRKIRFLFSLPGATKGELVKIESIKLKFTGKRFGWSDLFEKLMKLTKLKS